VRPACGTWLAITGEFEDAVFEHAFAEAARLERILSIHDPASEVSRLTDLRDASSELTEVLGLGARLEAESGGAFHLRDSQGRLDLGGIAKGYIVDRVFDTLPKDGDALVNAGGDLRARGAHEVEVRIPRATGEERRFTLQIQDAALATSSRLGAHLAVGSASARFDTSNLAATSAMMKPVMSAAVLAPTAALADGLTKAALFGGATPGAIAVWTFDENGDGPAVHA
jgi:thiamine biosynthesis lipoprotein